MTLDHVYTVLAKVQLDGELTVDCPSGGRLLLRSAGGDAPVHLDASDRAALRDLSQLTLSRSPRLSLRALRYLRNPLLQPVEVSVNGKDLLRWPPGRTPRVTSLSGLLGLLRAR